MSFRPCIFFDDILVYSRSLDHHYEHLQYVFKALQQKKYHAKLSKCVFRVTTMNYVGHIISAHGVQADPKKIESMQRWPMPHSFTSLRGFLGLNGYYRRFVYHYENIATPLTNILKLPQFEWNQQAASTFNLLKTTMARLPSLTLPNFSQPFDVTNKGCIGNGH